MNAAEWEALEAYVLKLRDELHLHDWQIRVDRDEPRDPGDNEGQQQLIDAQMEIRATAQYAILRVHANFRQGKPYDQRDSIVHELLHLHTDHVFSDALDMIEGLAGAQANATLRLLLTRSYERMTDALAGAIAPKYDLIEWPTKSSSRK